MSDLREAAARALETHDALRATQNREPACDDNGTPLNPTAWQGWHDGRYRPAYETWRRAMDALESVLGEPGLSRHPFNFRPRCEDILRG